MSYIDNTYQSGDHPPAGGAVKPINRDRLVSVLRIVIGLVILQYGMAKIIGWPQVASFAKIAPFSLVWFAGLIELLTGALLVVGLFTRPAAFLASGLMAFAYFISHAPRSFFPAVNGGTAAIVLCFAFLYLAVAGGGPWSLDAVWGRSRKKRT